MNGSFASFHVFQSLYTQYSIGFFAAVGSGLGHTEVAVARPFAATLTLWVLIQALLVMRGSMDFDRAMGKLLTLTIIVFLVTTATAYNTYITDLFLIDIPDFIAQTFTGVTAANFAAQFDVMENQYTAAGLIAYQHQGGIIASAILSMQLYIVQAVFTICLGVSFGVYLMAQYVTGLLVEIGVLILPFFLFERTKGIAERWLSKLIGLAGLIVLITASLSMFIVGSLRFINNEFSSNFSNLSVPEMLIIINMVLAWIAVQALISLFLPAVAAYIGGGAAMDISTIARPWRAI